MTDKQEENVQFKMRDEEIDEQVIPAEINELKLEKISHRVTLISIIIPVLIAVVIVITYLDIKKRVVQTEDTGSFEFNKLSSDLESRFSSVSLRQARMENAMEKLTSDINHSVAGIQVRLEKLDDAIASTGKKSVGQAEYEAARAELVDQINRVVDSTNQTSEQVAAITEKLKTQIDQLSTGLAAVNETLVEMDQRLIELEDKTIDKPAMDLAIRLETMRVSSDLKSRIESLENKLNTLESKLNAGDRQSSSPEPAGAPEKDQDGGASPDIEEQTISK